MPLPTRVISTEKLLERWGLTQSELFCLMVTKRLMPVYKTVGIDGWIHHEWNNFVEMLKGDDREKQVCVFSLPDVLKMETENEGLKSNSMHFLKGKEVMERCSISESELVDLLETSLDPVDPTGDVLDLNDSEFLVQFGVVSGADLLFREDDIQRIEKEYGIEVKMTLPKAKKDVIPTFSFYKNGQIWKIGEVGKEKDFISIVGIERIHYLLNYPGKDLNVKTVYSLGKEEVNSKSYDPGFEDISNSNEKPYIEGLFQDVVLDEQAKKAYEAQIEMLKEKIDLSENPDEIIEDKEQVELLTQELNDMKFMGKTKSFRSKNIESCRSTVQKTIRSALKTLHEVLPSLKGFLNKHTIVTGYDCRYKPDLDSPVKWILYPPDQ